MQWDMTATHLCFSQTVGELSRCDASCAAGMAAQELMARGRKGIRETDASLARSEKVIADTIAVGAATAATLVAQV